MSFASLFAPYHVAYICKAGCLWWEVREEVRTAMDTYSKIVARFDKEEDARAIQLLLNTQWRVEMGFVNE